MRWIIVFTVACLICGSYASADQAFSVSGGYSHVHFGRSSETFYNRDGGYVDGDVLWRIPAVPFPLVLGAGVNGSGYYDRHDGLSSFSNDFFDRDRLQSDVGLFSLEARAGIPIQLPFARGFFVMPRLGAGLLVDSYSIDRQSQSSGVTFFDTDDHQGAAFELRPALQAGYSWGSGSAGAEVSYMAAWGDFGRLGSTAREFRAGVFVRFRF